MGMRREVNVGVLLQRYPGENVWTATVPLIENCVSEAPTSEEATVEIAHQIQFFVDKDPNLLGLLGKEPELKVTTVRVQIDDPQDKVSDAQHPTRS